MTRPYHQNACSQHCGGKQHFRVVVSGAFKINSWQCQVQNFKLCEVQLNSFPMNSHTLRVLSTESKVRKQGVTQDLTLRVKGLNLNMGFLITGRTENFKASCQTSCCSDRTRALFSSAQGKVEKVLCCGAFV